MKILSFDLLPSTSSFAKENALHLPIPCVISASEQTLGRGRNGKSFFSPKSTGLYMTYLCPYPENGGLITPAAALAVTEALEELAGIKPSIKWVNDIFLNNKKICGILCECFERENKKFLCVGIGLNLTTASFPSDLPLAGSVGIDIDKALLIERIISHFESILSGWSDEKIAGEYSKKMLLLDKKITFSINNRQYEGKATGIDENCNLLVNSENEIFRLSSGEISIKDLI